jgi:uncharacterized membrane protein YbhN (UPF0104 family)
VEGGESQLTSSLTTSRRQKIGLMLRAILAVVLLIILFQFVDIGGVVAAFSKAQPANLLGALALVFANIGLQIAKWRYFVRLVNPANSNLEIAASLLFGISLGTITPGQIGEFGGRALRHRSLPAGSVVGLTLVDKLQMMCILGIGGTISLVVLYKIPSIFGITIITLVSLIGIFLFFNSMSLVGLVNRVKPELLEHRLLKEFFHAIGVFRRKDLFVSLVLSGLFYGVLYAQMHLLVNAFESVGPGTVFLGFAAMMFTKSLVPISFGDLGIREGISVYFFSLCGVASATSLSAALLLFVINILLPSVVGLFFIPKLPVR